MVSGEATLKQIELGKKISKDEKIFCKFCDTVRQFEIKELIKNEIKQPGS